MEYTLLKPNVYGLYKPAGLTPLQTLDVLREVAGISAEIPLTYAGRLDPMAEGLLLVLAGEAVHEKDVYLHLDKRYTVTALLGVETDSLDLLGIPITTSYKLQNLYPCSWAGMTKGGIGEEQVKKLLSSYIGEITLPLPLYSSPLVSGKPLFVHAKNATLKKVDVPFRTTNIYDCRLETLHSISALELLSYIQNTIPIVQGEFRQAEILQAWKDLLEDNLKLATITFSVQCSSGTYIRSLVEKLGQDLNTNACVYKLVRTKIGEYQMGM